MQNSPQPSLYWYDYETFGADPRRDRPVQFAGIRTDLDLNILGAPLTLYCRPSDDFLPHPEACLITGITPQKALAEGVPEAEFIRRIHNEFSRPRTCIVGYNNIRFDDEVTRFTLYRNFYDAYAHEWQNGNSRWDIIDMLRLTHALRPEGINWPINGEAKTSFRLDQLTVANHIEHGSAHDALADVEATIAMAKLIRQRQPRLYDFVFNHRGKQQVLELLQIHNPAPVVHVSSMYQAEQGCIALVLPLCMHPSNKNEVLVYDLRIDPQAYLQLDVDAIQQRLFTRTDELPEGMQRLPVKGVHINKCPVVVPANTLTPEAAEKWGINLEAAEKYQERLVNARNFIRNLQSAYGKRQFENSNDPDLMLYEGGFFSNDDRTRMDVVRHSAPESLAKLDLPFEDRRLPEMLFRYRARNYPQMLNAGEKQQWNEFRRHRLLETSDTSALTLATFSEHIVRLRNSMQLDAKQQQILAALEEYADTLSASL